MKSGYTLVRVHPQVSPRIFQQTGDCVARKAVSSVVTGEGTCHEIKSSEPGEGRYPQRVGAIRLYTGHHIIVEASIVAGSCLVNSEPPRRGIKAIQTRIASAEPKGATLIFCYR